MEVYPKKFELSRTNGSWENGLESLTFENHQFYQLLTDTEKMNDMYSDVSLCLHHCTYTDTILNSLIMLRQHEQIHFNYYFNTFSSYNSNIVLLKNYYSHDNYTLGCYKCKLDNSISLHKGLYSLGSTKTKNNWFFLMWAYFSTKIIW